MPDKNLRSIMDADDTLKQLEEFLEERTVPTCIAFVDLCGSSALKARPQKEWLPIMCRFLVTVSECVKKHRGNVIKYIGDEVFAVFEQDETDLAVNRTEGFVWECEARLHPLGPDYRAKYAFDYGQGASIDFSNAPRDVLGTCVDRCARMSAIAEAHTALASSFFVEKSKQPDSWDHIHTFAFRGLPESVEVFQLKGLGPRISVADANLTVQAPKQLAAEVLRLREDLDRCRDELRMHRSR